MKAATTVRWWSRNGRIRFWSALISLSSCGFFRAFRSEFFIWCPKSFGERTDQVGFRKHIISVHGRYIELDRSMHGNAVEFSIGYSADRSDIVFRSRKRIQSLARSEVYYLSSSTAPFSPRLRWGFFNVCCFFFPFCFCTSLDG